MDSELPPNQFRYLRRPKPWLTRRVYDRMQFMKKEFNIGEQEARALSQLLEELCFGPEAR